MENRLMVTASTHPVKNEILDYVEYIKNNNIDIDMFHVDIMDGVFVEDKTFEYQTVEEIRKITTLPLDCHLMVKEPQNVIDKYIDAGVNILTVHYEAFEKERDLIACLKKIKEKGCLVGISIKPATRVSQIAKYLEMLDLVLIMSVEPGKSGQKFIMDSVNKIASLKNLTKELDKKILIEVDGGINAETIKFVKKVNVDMVVSGSALYKSTDKNLLINELRNA
ncbi:MAG: ribulose-phosphate 3-epimerase [Clostridia bacterium]|nr:ribulose-phosphate 3-epimerase [Clostridia bacterium]